MPRYLISGQEYIIDQKTLEDKASTLIPEPLVRVTHTVEICGKVFPIKQLIAEVTGVRKKELISLIAYEILASIGYQIKFSRYVRNKVE